MIAITGPTASGKTSLAIDIALKLNLEIISSDSLLIYKYLNIGTAKPTKENLKKVKHHMIDIINPWEEYNASFYERDAKKIIENLKEKNKNFIITGGTGLYLKALFNETFKAPPSDISFRNEIENKINNKEITLFNLYEELKKIDPETASKVHANDKYRIIRALEVYKLSGKTMSSFRNEHGSKENKLKYKIIVLMPEKDILIKNIERRTYEMIEKGLIEEAKSLIKMGCDKSLKPLKSIGYKEAFQYLNNEITKEELIDNIIKNTKALAKRQLTWFKKQQNTLWLDPNNKETKEIIISEIVKYLN